MHRNQRKAIAVLVAALAVVVLLLIHGISSWFVGSNVAFEVAAAEASEILHLVCDSAVEESVEGFIRSGAVEPALHQDQEERDAYVFADRLRSLDVGQALRTRFKARNTVKAAGPMGVEVVDVGLGAVVSGAIPQGPLPDPAACLILEGVLAKWAAVQG